MGWFSDICSAVGRAVGSAASAIYEKAKNVGVKVLGFMANTADKVVNTVKHVWNAVVPYIDAIREGLKKAALAVPWPWAKTALLGLEKGLAAIEKFANSAMAKKIDLAIKWAIEMARRWLASQQKKEEERLSEEDLAEAKRHQENLRMVGREINPEDRQYLEIASLLNDYQIAKTDLANALDAEPENFEHYLRLRATQKLLAMSDKKFRNAQSIDDLTIDDLFLVEIASDLVKANPELSNEAAARLDRILTQKYNRKLTPFVFEEMIASWAMRADTMGKQWEEENKAFAKAKIQLMALEQAKKIQNELSATDQNDLTRLEKEVPTLKAALNALSTQKVDLERYVGAGEGFLQLLEKSQEEIEAEDRSYLLEDSTKVGTLLIDIAEHDRPFAVLELEEQSLITDYANIFYEEAQDRKKRILEVAA